MRYLLKRFANRFALSVAKGRDADTWIRRADWLAPSSSMACAAITTLVSAFATTAAALPARADAKLMPHRAVYDLELARAGATAGMVRLKGRLVFELKGAACAGFEQTMRFVTQSANSDGDETLSDIRSSLKERRFRDASRADQLEFKNETFRNRRLSDRVEGRASRKQAGGLALKLRRPKRKEVALGARDILFPVSHSMALLAAARSGETVFSAPLYDGGDKGEKLYNT
ncbi:MAG: DUF1849 family protein, partial [Pseudomonadota bacterium]